MIIFEPNSALSNGIAQVWIAASGGASWGGCNVWLSPDGNTYEKIGTIESPAREGVLYGALTAPGTANPDLVSSCLADLTMSAGQLLTATNADAQAARTLCYVDGELIAYATATLTATSKYALTYLERGLYGTAAVAHATGAKFARLDDAVFKYNLPVAYVGQTVYLKLTSFNQFGRNEQTLDEVDAVTYTPIGTGFAIAPPTGAALTPYVDPQGSGASVQGMLLTWNASPGPLLGNYAIQWSLDGGVTWSNGHAGAGAVQFPISPVPASTAVIARVLAVSQNGQASSTWDTTPSTNSGAAGGISTIPNNEVLGNNSGATAAPVGISASAVLDMIGSTQGDVLFRSAAGWNVLAPTMARRLLATGGAGANPSYISLTLSDLSFAGVANGVATLDGSGKLTSGQIPASLVGGLNYQGTWNASTNSPTLASGTGTKGWFYKVNVAGGTTLDGISQWNVGDLVAFDGTTWDKIDGVANEVRTVAGRYGDVVLVAADIGGLAASATTDTTNAANISSGTLAAARLPALTGDISTSAGSTATTLATVNANVGSFALATLTVNAKGLVTAASAAATTGTGAVVLATAPTVTTLTATGSLIAKGGANPTATTTCGLAWASSGAAFYTFVDSTRTTNNRIAEWVWSSGALVGRFANDAYNAATNFMTVTGGQGAGITSIQFPILAVNALAGTGNRAVYSDPSGSLTNTSSDRRLKRDIADSPYGLETALQLAARAFFWRAEKRGMGRQIGFVAQEVMALVPEAVGVNADGMLSAPDPIVLCAVLAKAVQQLHAELIQLRQSGDRK